MAARHEVTISRAEAKAFYDRFGAKQDAQGWYEDRAVARLIELAGLAHATSVVELGCGTGRVAATLLERVLSAGARYQGFDQSETMIALASGRLARFGERARVARTDGTPSFPLPDASADRVLATYVLDLLSSEDIALALEDAHRVLEPGGRLCLVGLTFGDGLLSGAISRLWARIQRLAPAKVGGCRPLRVTEHLRATAWTVDHREVVTAWAIASEVVVATPRGR